MKQTVKHFPFSPGIGWKLKNGKYIIPEVTLDAWNRVIENREIVVTAFGGLIESFVSLCLLEAINYYFPKHKLHWCGDSRFNKLVQMNGLASIFEDNETIRSILSDYPTPIFLDRKRYLYMNCLNNYIDVKPYYGIGGFRDKASVIQQIFKNSTLQWEERFIPQFRKVSSCTSDLLRWARLVKFDLNKPYCCIFPDRGLSECKKSALQWSDQQIRSFVAMQKQNNTNSLIFTNKPNRFNNICAGTLPVRLDFVIHLLKNANLVLAEEIDFSIIANMLSSAKLISKNIKDGRNLNKNNRYLNHQNDIYIARTFSPLDVFNFIHKNDS